jgi:hypothetical protein
MKKLIMFLLVHVSPNAIFSQVVDTTQPIRAFDASKWGSPVTSSSPAPITFQTGTVEWRHPMNADTACEWMHLSIRDVGFVIARKALAVRVNGYCVKHLKSDGKPFPVHWRVGWCEGRERLLNTLVNERRGKQ